MLLFGDLILYLRTFEIMNVYALIFPDLFKFHPLLIFQ